MRRFTDKSVVPVEVKLYGPDGNLVEKIAKTSLKANYLHQELTSKTEHVTLLSGARTVGQQEARQV